jgi:hypothetical protein
MEQTKLILPESFEEARATLNPSSATYDERLAQFVQPIEDTERQIIDIVSRLPGGAGRAVILLGSTGTGKSTFIQSLTWRSHLGFARLESIDCSELNAQSRLNDLAAQLQSISSDARERRGITAVSIDYLESLGGIADAEKRAFFQTLNGLLRRTPVFVVWPVTDRLDAEAMLKEARLVSNTIFDSILPVLDFRGPSPNDFPSIARNTISVFNDSKTLQDFLLTEGELDQLRKELIANVESSCSIREYMASVFSLWAEKSGYLDTLSKLLPKPNEIWFVFCYPEAEEVVSTFSTKGSHAPSAWLAYHAKLWEYVVDSQRLGKWKSATRLQYALGGALTTRIMYLPTYALISCVAAYGSNTKLSGIKQLVPEGWLNKSTAKSHLENSPLYRQLVGNTPPKGLTKGGPAATARSQSDAPFQELNKLVSGSGNDRHVNHAVASCLLEKLDASFEVQAEKEHPWIPEITPDIRVDTPEGKQICIELCYTANTKPGAIPDYVLKKLAVYMEQLEQYVQAPIDA